MDNATFRQASTPSESKTSEAQKPEQATNTQTSVSEDVPVPYLDFKNTHNKPFTAEYFELGSLWDDMDGGFKSELSIIESYMFNLIGDGKIENSTEAVTAKIKNIEKQAGIKKFDTTSNRISKVVAFTKFLRDVEDL